MAKDYSDSYSESGFWDHAKKYGRGFAQDQLANLFLCYYAFSSPDVPLWAKSTLLGALGYFVMPLDAIPDFMPPVPVGFTDDFGVIGAALTAVAVHITPAMREQAKQKAAEWLN